MLLGCFTGNNVQPLLEYASPVWCLAAESTLKKLTPVHIAALRAAPGARPSTSRDALYVYCGVWSLETRRTFLCVSAFLRITRRSTSQHPIARSHEQWQNSGDRDNRSFFAYATALIRAQKRFHKISDGGPEFAGKEKHCSPAPWIEQPILAALHDRDVAVQHHKELFLYLCTLMVLV